MADRKACSSRGEHDGEWGIWHLKLAISPAAVAVAFAVSNAIAIASQAFSYKRAPYRIILSLLAVVALSQETTATQAQSNTAALIQDYLNAAFSCGSGCGPDLADDSSMGFKTGLTKRDPKVGNEILLATGPSSRDAEDEIRLIIANVLADMRAHAQEFEYHLISKAEEGAMQSGSRQQFISATANAILVFVGTKQEIDDLTVAQEKNGVRGVRSAVEASEAEGVSSGRPICTAVTFLERSNKYLVKSANTYVELRDKEKIMPCLYDLLMSSSGLSGSMLAPMQSIFSLTAQSPTQRDWDMWRLHQNPQLRPGMSRDEAEAAAAKIMSE